jgi:hypothetical protein
MNAKKVMLNSAVLIAFCGLTACSKDAPIAADTAPEIEK